jgi:hypothetical protein
VSSICIQTIRGLSFVPTVGVLEVAGRMAGEGEGAIAVERRRDRARLVRTDVGNLGRALLVGEGVGERPDHELMDGLADVVDLEGDRLALHGLDDAGRELQQVVGGQRDDPRRRRGAGREAEGGLRDDGRRQRDDRGRRRGGRRHRHEGQ